MMLNRKNRLTKLAREREVKELSTNGLKGTFNISKMNSKNKEHPLYLRNLIRSFVLRVKHIFFARGKGLCLKLLNFTK